MAKYSNTKAKINEKIATNGRQAVTGAILNDVLQTMVDSLGADYQFGGLVQPGSSFTAGEQPVVFLATTPGTYTNFGGLVVADGEVALLVWSGTAWSKQTPDIATKTEVSQLGQYVENPEWVRVVTDSEGRVLYGVKVDGNFYFEKGCPPQIVEHVARLLVGKVDKVEGKSLIDSEYAASQQTIDNPEYMKVTTDSEGRVIMGIKANGEAYFAKGISGISDSVAELKKCATEIPVIKYGVPFAILSNKDEDATALDERELTYFNIIQLSESMFYMYYSALGDGEASEFNQNILFAYSTDGIHYQRGFPQGIEPPFPGTNRIFSDTQPVNISGQFVFKCLDAEFPFRMVAEQQEGENVFYTNMYKSRDGIIWDMSTKRTLCYEVNDTQHSVVVRGNIFKLFTRTKTDNGTNRRICVYYFDQEGNLLSPQKILESNYVYNSAAIAIDDRHEIINPSVFDNRDGSQDYQLESIFVDGYNEHKMISNIDSIVDKAGADKWATFSPTLITIAGAQYLGFNTRNIYHDDGFAPDNISQFKLVKVEIIR